MKDGRWTRSFDHRHAEQTLSSASDPAVTTEGARREKRRGLQHVACRRFRASLGFDTEEQSAKAHSRERDSQPLLVPSACMSILSPSPQEGRVWPSKPIVDEQLASFPQRSKDRGARETRWRHPSPGARISRSRTCPCVVVMKCCCRSLQAVRGSSDRLPLSGESMTDPSSLVLRLLRFAP